MSDQRGTRPLRVEWQVHLFRPGEVHIFKTKRSAEEFAKQHRSIEMHEGGLVSSRRAEVLKVVRYAH